MKLVHDLLDNAVISFPEKYAVISEEGSTTYMELSDQVNQIARWLLVKGIKKGDRVVLILSNSIPLISCIFATSKIGALFVILNYEIKKYTLDHILNDSEPAIIITNKILERELEKSNYLDRVSLIDNVIYEASSHNTNEQVSTKITPEDHACLLYTSGSTGKPKAIISAHNNVIFATKSIQECIGINHDDIVGNFLPLSFDYGLYQVFLSFQVGASIALGDYKQSGLQLLKKIIEWKITGLPVVPNLSLTLIKLLNRSYQSFDQIRFITNTGASLPSSYIRELQRIMPNCQIYLMYGLTECKRVSILNAEEINNRINSVGKPLPNTECLIVDKTGSRVPHGQVGELVVRGPHVMQGYWRAPELTKQRFKNWGEGLEKVLYTGDMCSIDFEGYLYFHGRTDEIYKQNGFRVSAMEIEEAALDILEIEQAALIYSNIRQVATLFVTTTQKISEDDVKGMLANKLESYKIPKYCVIVATFPLLSNGKIDKTELKSLIEHKDMNDK